ncbi:fasciclin domain-containing protein [Sinomonas cellulolyticus]|uniref:Fasciclin domain-containing protein n=1 Tax=Sinomonas cellulolyticus TaxID=2801916 RepID=A0ABS1K6J4_9MICC|nr:MULTISPECIES: fasciclin domain-containing protein [Sinomonas]MBL0706967.1 fasciclin domain-containing protein [Sinomonas cellulolyticus]
MNTITRTSATVGLAALGMLGLAACGGTTAASDSPSSAMSSGGGSSMAASPSKSTMSAMDPAANLVGPGCADYAKANPSGAASVQGMSADPVAVAASNNPLLTTLTAAVSGKLNPKVNLVDTLDGGQFTVFAPVDSAFAKIDPATINSLKTDDATLSKILTYHVVPGQIEPASIAGSHKTVEGQDVTVTGSGNSLQVNGANVICGGVRTANATVYLVDTVLMPPAK